MFQKVSKTVQKNMKRKRTVVTLALAPEIIVLPRKYAARSGRMAGFGSTATSWEM